MNRTPLYDIQRDQNAHFSDIDGWEKAIDYGDCLVEHAAARQSIGLLDRVERGKLVVTGKDRFSWLQGMVSNDIRLLEQGAPVVYACILDSTGHLLADVAIVRRDGSLLLDMARVNVEKIFRLLDGYIITEDIELSDQSDFLACLSVQGPHADEAWVRGHVSATTSVTVVAADHTGLGGFDLYVPMSQAPALWSHWTAEGLPPIGEAAADTLRIEAGIPVYGAELDERVLPPEAGLETTHISFTKGCYIGQEVIARIHSRGHTNRALTGLLLEDPRMPNKNDKIYSTDEEVGREVGWVTSATHSPVLQHTVALAYVRHEYRVPGIRLRIARVDDVVSATVTSLPFCGR